MSKLLLVTISQKWSVLLYLKRLCFWGFGLQCFLNILSQSRETNYWFVWKYTTETILSCENWTPKKALGAALLMRKKKEKKRPPLCKKTSFSDGVACKKKTLAAGSSLHKKKCKLALTIFERLRGISQLRRHKSNKSKHTFVVAHTLFSEKKIVTGVTAWWHKRWNEPNCYYQWTSAYCALVCIQHAANLRFHTDQISVWIQHQVWSYGPAGHIVCRAYCRSSLRCFHSSIHSAHLVQPETLEYTVNPLTPISIAAVCGCYLCP